MRVKKSITILTVLHDEVIGKVCIEDELPPVHIPSKYMKDKKVGEHSYLYHLEAYEDESIFEEFAELKEKWDNAPENGVGHVLDLFEESVEYTSEELEHAVGYVFPYFGVPRKDMCDTNDMVENCEWCDECEEYGRQISPYILKKEKKLERWNQMKKVFYHYSVETIFVSIPMYHYLIEHEVSPDYFIPAYCGIRKKTLAGYQLISKNQFPKGVYIDPMYEYSETCQHCGRHRVKTVMKGRESYYFHNLYLDMEKITRWEDMNETYESYYEKPVLIVNKRMKELLEEADPSLKMMPLFPKEMMGKF